MPSARNRAASAFRVVDLEEEEIAAAGTNPSDDWRARAEAVAMRSRSALMRAIRSSWIARREGASAASAASTDGLGIG